MLSKTFLPGSRRPAPLGTMLESKHLKRTLLGFGAGLLLLWVVLQLTPSAPAPQPAALSGLPVRQAPSHGMFGPGYLIVLLLLAGGGLYALHLRRKNPATGLSRNPLQSIGHLSLAPGQQVRLVSCGEDVLLLGISSGQISLLKTYDASVFSSREMARVHDLRPVPTIDATPAEASFRHVLHYYAHHRDTASGRLAS